MSTFRTKVSVRRTSLAAVLTTAVLVASMVAPASLNVTGSAYANDRVSVIVQKVPGSGNVAEQGIAGLGGKVDFDLPVINGFSATVSVASLGKLQSLPGVRFVTNDQSVYMQSDPSEGNGTPVNDQNVYQQEIGADVAHTSGFTGEGVTVALIDTGVADVPDLAGRVVGVKNPLGQTKSCVDISGESNCNDSYGHGTFLAGLIAGSGASSNGKYKGVSPDAKVLSIKIAGKDGSSSVGKILYAIQWVVSNKTKYGVKVLNLALGTDSPQSYKHDPLNFAVEQAWNAGISVVVSAGNRGPAEKTISKPADDPYVITTGAVDDLGTPSSSDDIIPDFSSQGPTIADDLTKPDLTAPGTRLISLRSPNSSIEEQFPGGGVDAIYRRGSGTSQSAAVVSGAAAVLLSAHPELTPNQVKYALTSSTQPVANSTPNQVGAGLIDVGSAVANLPVGEANQGLDSSQGDGPLANSRGSLTVVSQSGNAILGLIGAVIPTDGSDSSNATGLGWFRTGWYGNGWYGNGWYGSGWYGSGWYGNGWYGSGWYGSGWYGNGWYGSGWYGSGWYGNGWYGSGWYGSGWYGNGWYGSGWYGSGWYGVWD